MNKSVKIIASIILFTALLGGLGRDLIFHHQTAAAATTCDAPTQTKTIQQVVWDPNCDIVHIIDGTHDVQTIWVDHNVIIEGDGASKAILNGDGSGVIIGIFNNPTNVEIKGLTLRNGNGGISINNGNVLIENSRIISNTNNTNTAGGIIIYDGDVTIRQSEISGNSTPLSAGGIHNQGTLTLENTTISNNLANVAGGIHNGGTLTMTHTTIANNHLRAPFTLAPGIDNGGTIRFKNSIVANGAEDDCHIVESGVYISLGNNLEDGNSCNFNLGNDLIGTNPLLQPLAANDGETYSHALPSNSPAVDAGADIHCLTYDQRHIKRPTTKCDVGAYEFTLRHTFMPLITKP